MTMVRHKLSYGVVTILILVAGIVAFFLRNEIRNVLAYGGNDWPTHPAYDGCQWVKRTFSRVVLFEQECSNPSLQASLIESKDGALIQTSPTQNGNRFQLQIFTKSPGQSPLDVVREWYGKLTPEQQNVCEIQDPDTTVEYFPDGSIKSGEGPHPTAHKTRYKIDIKPAISK